MAIPAAAFPIHQSSVSCRYERALLCRPIFNGSLKAQLGLQRKKTLSSSSPPPSPLPLPLSFSVASFPILLPSNRHPSGAPRAALNDSRSEVFQGVYGPWSIDDNDVREVFLYRAGLVTTAVALVATATKAFLPQDNALRSIIEQYSDVFYCVGAGGLGISLLLIHIYVTPIKRALQLLWALGVLGSIFVTTNFAAPADETLINYVLENRWAIWLVGPLFASLTGLVFKEGLCYGKLEAGLLVFVIPTLLLGHLSGAMDEKVESPLLLAWMILYSVFAARKFTQPIKDDIGDKSIFIFNALPKEEQEARLSKIQKQTQLNEDE